jgi:nucleotidyltransferase/DNA polymerase involved in DNA repair
MWGVGPATKARLADIGVVRIGQLAEIPGWTLSNVLGSAAGEKLAALSWNRDPREIKAHRRAHSAGAQLALGRKPADEKVFKPALLQLADRVATRLRALRWHDELTTVGEMIESLAAREGKTERDPQSSLACFSLPDPGSSRHRRSDTPRLCCFGVKRLMGDLSIDSGRQSRRGRR